jgi:hypothetical protein
MFLDFLARAYFPHMVLVAIAFVVFSSQPQWPDEEWARPYETTRSKTNDAYLRRWKFDRGTAEHKQVEREWEDGRREIAAVDYRLAEGRRPVYLALLKRAALLAFLTALCFLLSDSLTSVSGRLRLLPDGQSFLTLLAGTIVGGLLLAFIACRDARLATVLFILIDGLALTCLLCTRDVAGIFAQAYLDANRWQENRQAELRSGVPGARRAVEQFYADHRALLWDTFPEALFRSALNAAIPEGTSPADAWAAVKKIIEQLQPRIEKVKEARRQEEERRQQAEASACKTQTQIEALQQRIDALAGRDDEESLELLAVLRRQMTQLQGKSTRNPVTPDDL